MPNAVRAARPQTTSQATPAQAAAPAPAAAPARAGGGATPVVRLREGALPRRFSAEDAEGLARAAGAGEPLPEPVRATLEKGLGADLSGVRVHRGGQAAEAVEMLSARAVTYGANVFLGPRERATDVALMAHEVAHVVQQQGAPKKAQRFTRGGGDACEAEAERAASAVSSGRQFDVRERTSGQRVQRLGFGDILDWFADKANAIPGFRMFTIVLGVNPINMSRVDRSAANILRAVVEFIPGGNLITRALDTYGIFDKVGNWIEGQFKSLGMVGAAFKQAITDFIDSLGWRDLLRPGSVWRRAKRIFTDPVDRLINFAKGFIGGILDFLREAVLRPLAKLAEGTRAYDLLKAVLGKDPITGDPVPQTADALIGGFMKLIGQEEVYNNLKKSNAIGRAFAWFKGVLGGALAFVRAVPGLIISTLTSITLSDFLPITNLFSKVGRAFGGFIGSFLSWGLDQVLALLQIIFEVVAPSAVPYIKKAGGAFKEIVRNPIRFVSTLVRAGIQGFRQFGRNFLTHLRKSMIEWLTGSMSGAGIYIPQSLTLGEIVKFALSVLGLTWQNIRSKLLRVVPEPVVQAMEAGFDVVRTLVTQGPAAAWQQIVEGVSNLQQMVMEQVISFVKQKVVEKAIQTLVSSLNPAGAFIQAIIAIYNTIMFFIERIKQIARVAASFIDSIASIASGNIATAAKRVETTMAGLLTLVISFLARLAGFGRVSAEVTKIINRVRQPIDNALNRVVDWIVAQARRLGRFVAQAGVPQDPATRLRLASQAAVAAARRLTGRITAGMLNSVLGAIKLRYGLNVLQPYEQRGTWWVRATINPTATTNLGVSSAAGGGHLPSDGEVGKSVPFSAGGEGHRIWIDVRGQSAQVMMSSATKPLSEHLTDWRTLARDIENATTKNRVLGWIGTALGHARRIQDLSRQATAHRIDTPQRDGFDTQIEAEEELVRPILADIINALDLPVPERLPTPIDVHFTVNPMLNPVEYARQLRLQQAGINGMVVHDWIENRRRYIVRGRHPLSNNAQQNLRTRLKARLIQRLTQPINVTSPDVGAYAEAFILSVFNDFSPSTRYRGLGYDTAVEKMEEWMSRQEALHSPDQVAGGPYLQLTGVGTGYVNGDIGANWGGFTRMNKPTHLADKLHEDVLAEMRRLNIRRALWRQVKMNVRLLM